MSSFQCKIATGVVTRQVELHVTTSKICIESKIFGQKSREYIPFNKISNVYVSPEKNILSVITEKKRKKFVMKPDDLPKCYSYLENFNGSQKSVKLVSYMRSHSSPEFSNMELKSDEWEIILTDSNYTSLRFSKDDVIMQQGLKYNMVCQISSGTVRVEKHHDDSMNTVKLATLGVGEIFGEITFVSGGLASASVIAAEDVDLFVIHQRSLDKLFATQGCASIVLKFYHYLCSVLAKRIVEQERVLLQQNRPKRKPDQPPPR